VPETVSPPETPPLPGAARAAILAWYDERGRPLPFRRTSDPYAILVSEAMAQQTQAARAGEAWERFITRFPDVEALAAASPADVLRAWQGLGYDRRALNLWRTARVVVADHDGRLPRTIDGLEALPGIGPYTARAVAALAFGMPVGAVDTNVRRVLGRILAGDPARLTSRAMQAAADAAVAPDRPGDWTHAVMDVGATVCKPARPRCPACPAMTWCRYAAGAATVVAAGPAEPTTEPSDARAHRRAHAPRAAAHAARRVPARAREAATPFRATTRWLRGRLLDRLRAAPDGEWVEIDGDIGEHELPAVADALRALARDGMVELAPVPEGPLRARLPLG
jgi:A/G-specific adenine glycosylase